MRPSNPNTHSLEQFGYAGKHRLAMGPLSHTSSASVAESCASALYAVCSVMYLRSRQFFVMNSSVQQKSKAESEIRSHRSRSLSVAKNRR